MSTISLYSNYSDTRLLYVIEESGCIPYNNRRGRVSVRVKKVMYNHNKEVINITDAQWGVHVCASPCDKQRRVRSAVRA